MEPFALQLSQSRLIGPAIDLQSDLGAVLREGRVLPGEVLQTLDGETILIGVGSHRVPARSRVPLQPGHKFLFQVEREGDTLVLRILGEGEAGESSLLQALRRVMGQDQPLGELLQRLAGALRALSGDSSGAATAAGKLLGELAGHLFEPGSAGAELRARVGGSGLAYEARLADAALRSLPPARLQSLASELRSTLLEGLRAGVPGAVANGFEAALQRALVDLLGGAAELEQGLLRWSRGQPPAEGAEPLPRDLGGLLRRALAQLELGPARATVSANLHDTGLASLGRGLQRVLLGALLGLPASTALGAGLGAVELAWVDSDLKGQLLRSLAELPGGAAREAVGRALAGLEAEQLLNLARGQSHEPLHWSLLVPDGARWTTAHLFLRRTADEEARHPSGATGAHRMTIAVEFSHTGPVRADLVVQPGSLAMRVVATRQDVVETLGRRLVDLEQRLAAEGRRVKVVVSMAAEEQVRVDAGSAHDIRYLRDHRLMDTRG